VRGDPATSPTLAELRQARAQQEGAQRWVRRLAPLLLSLFVLGAFDGHPRPGLAGAGLIVSVAVGAFVVGFLGLGQVSNRLPTRRPGGAHWAFIADIVASSVALTLAQRQGSGPGPAGICLGVIMFALFARTLPGRAGRAAVPVAAVAFVVLEVVTAITSGSVGSPALLAVLAALFGMMVLANRLGEATEQAAALLEELERTRASEARAVGLAERQRLAREMHDVLAHSLSGLMIQLASARMLVAEDPTDPRLPEVIDRAHHLGRSGLEEARRAIGMLRDDELPGPGRLAGLAAQFQADRGIPCQFTVSGEEHELGSEARLALYRVAQEALTNITKHAHAERVELRLAYEASATRLTVEDVTAGDGTAPRPSEGPSSGGYGLTGMRERAELLGGTLITEATDHGFRVELAVPT